MVTVRPRFPIARDYVVLFEDDPSKVQLLNPALSAKALTISVVRGVEFLFAVFCDHLETRAKFARAASSIHQSVAAEIAVFSNPSAVSCRTKQFVIFQFHVTAYEYTRSRMALRAFRLASSVRAGMISKCRRHAVIGDFENRLILSF